MRTGDEDRKNFAHPLDIGSHINACAQPRLEAGAQRTLEDVGCSAWFGWVTVSRLRILASLLPEYRKMSGRGQYH
jgi:hypothetical protein